MKCLEFLMILLNSRFRFHQENTRYLEEYVGEWKLSKDLAASKQITMIGMSIIF